MNAMIKEMVKDQLSYCASLTDEIRQVCVANQAAFEGHITDDTVNIPPEHQAQLSSLGLKLAMAFDGVMALGMLGGMLQRAAEVVDLPEYNTSEPDETELTSADILATEDAAADEAAPQSH